MARIYNSIEETVGKTPLIRLGRLEKQYGLECTLLAKAEFFNMAGSVKDRVAMEIISQGEKDGYITKDTVIIEPTSGNTGIGIAAVCAAKGMKAIIVMPENMSEERKMLISAYGATLVLTPAEEGMAGAIAEAERIRAKTLGSMIAGQFTNPANPRAHFLTTGPEIYEDTDGKVDIFVCGVGTGGTITGVGSYLKSKNKNIKVIAAEPAESAVLSGGEKGAHGIQGIGAGFVPEVLDVTVYDEVIPVSTADAIKTAKEVAKAEGMLVGISSGAAIYAAVQVCKKKENKSKTVVVLIPDSGERYLSAGLFE